MCILRPKDGVVTGPEKHAGAGVRLRQKQDVLFLLIGDGFRQLASLGKVDALGTGDEILNVIVSVVRLKIDALGGTRAIALNTGTGAVWQRDPAVG